MSRSNIVVTSSGIRIGSAYMAQPPRDMGREAERIQSALLTARTSRFERVIEWIDRWAIHAYILMALGGVVLGCLGVFR